MSNSNDKNMSLSTSNSMSTDNLANSVNTNKVFIPRYSRSRRNRINLENQLRLKENIARRKIREEPRILVHDSETLHHPSEEDNSARIHPLRLGEQPDPKVLTVVENDAVLKQFNALIPHPDDAHSQNLIKIMTADPHDIADAYHGDYNLDLEATFHERPTLEMWLTAYRTRSNAEFCPAKTQVKAVSSLDPIKENKLVALLDDVYSNATPEKYGFVCFEYLKVPAVALPQTIVEASGPLVVRLFKSFIRIPSEISVYYHSDLSKECVLQHIMELVVPYTKLICNPLVQAILAKTPEEFSSRVYSTAVCLLRFMSTSDLSYVEQALHYRVCMHIEAQSLWSKPMDDSTSWFDFLLDKAKEVLMVIVAPFMKVFDWISSMVTSFVEVIANMFSFLKDPSGFAVKLSKETLVNLFELQQPDILSGGIAHQTQPWYTRFVPLFVILACIALFSAGIISAPSLYRMMSTGETIVAQGPSSLLTTIATTALTPFITKSFSACDMADEVRRISGLAIGLGTVSHCLMAFTGYMPTMLRKLFTRLLGDKNANVNLDATTLYNKASTILSYANDPRVITLPAYKEAVNQTMVDIMDLASKYPDASGTLYAATLRSYEKLVKVASVIKVYDNVPSRCLAPFWLHLWGLPGCGKTIIARWIVMALSTIRGLCEDPDHMRNTRIYSRNIADAYWSGYFENTYDTIFIDEFLQEADQKLNKEQMNEMLPLVSSSEYRVNMASNEISSVGIKGTMIDSGLIITANNRQSLIGDIPSDVTDGVLRRRSMSVQVVVDPKCFKATKLGDGRYKVDHIAEHDIIYSVKFRIHDPSVETTDRVLSHHDMNFTEFVNYLAKQMANHYAHLRKLNGYVSKTGANEGLKDVLEGNKTDDVYTQFMGKILQAEGIISASTVKACSDLACVGQAPEPNQGPEQEQEERPNDQMVDEEDGGHHEEEDQEEADETKLVDVKDQWYVTSKFNNLKFPTAPVANIALSEEDREAFKAMYTQHPELSLIDESIAVDVHAWRMLVDDKLESFGYTNLSYPQIIYTLSEFEHNQKMDDIPYWLRLNYLLQNKVFITTEKLCQLKNLATEPKITNMRWRRVESKGEVFQWPGIHLSGDPSWEVVRETLIGAGIFEDKKVDVKVTLEKGAIDKVSYTYTKGLPVVRQVVREDVDSVELRAFQTSAQRKKSNIQGAEKLPVLSASWEKQGYSYLPTNPIIYTPRIAIDPFHGIVFIQESRQVNKRTIGATDYKVRSVYHNGYYYPSYRDMDMASALAHAMADFYLVPVNFYMGTALALVQWSYAPTMKPIPLAGEWVIANMKTSLRFPIVDSMIKYKIHSSQLLSRWEDDRYKMPALPRLNPLPSGDPFMLAPCTNGDWLYSSQQSHIGYSKNFQYAVLHRKDDYYAKAVDAMLQVCKQDATYRACDLKVYELQTEEYLSATTSEIEEEEEKELTAEQLEKIVGFGTKPAPKTGLFSSMKPENLPKLERFDVTEPREDTGDVRELNQRLIKNARDIPPPPILHFIDNSSNHQLDEYAKNTTRRWALMGTALITAVGVVWYLVRKYRQSAVPKDEEIEGLPVGDPEEFYFPVAQGRRDDYVHSAPLSSAVVGVVRPKSVVSRFDPTATAQSPGAKGTVLLHFPNSNIVRGYALRTGFVVVYGHGFLQYMEYAKRLFPDSKDFCIVLEGHGLVSSYYYQPFDMSNVVCIRTAEEASPEVFVVDIRYGAKGIGSMANTINTIATEADHDLIASRPTHTRMSTTLPGASTVWGQYKRAQSYTAGTLGTMYLDWAYTYSHKAQAGDCGNLLRANFNGTDRIIGMHVAGSASSNYCIAVPLVREELEQAISTFPEQIPHRENDMRGQSKPIMRIIQDLGADRDRIGQMEFVPQSQRVFVPEKTAFVKSPLCPETPTLSPCHLTPFTNAEGKSINPDETLLRALGGHPANTIPKEELRAAAESYIANLDKWVTKNQPTGDFSYADALKGSAVHGMNPMNLKSGPGYGHKKKEECILRDEDGTVLGPNNTLLGEIEEMLEEIDTTGKCQSDIVLMFKKDDVVPREKAEAGKIRSIFCHMLRKTLYERKAYWRAISFFNNASGEVNISVPTDTSLVHSTVYQWLCPNGNENPYFIDGDFSKFDASHSLETLQCCYGIIYHVLEKLGTPKEDLRRFWPLAETNYSPCVQYKDARFRLLYYHASGSTWTTIVNCIANSLYFRVAIARAQPSLPFDSNYRLIVLGDDNVLHGLSSVCIDQATLARTFKSMGLTYTTASKDSNFAKYKTLEQVSFLGRHFVRVGKVWTMRFDLDRNIAASEWTRGIDVWPDKAHSLYLLLAHHEGPEAEKLAIAYRDQFSHEQYLVAPGLKELSRVCLNRDDADVDFFILDIIGHSMPVTIEPGSESEVSDDESVASIGAEQSGLEPGTEVVQMGQESYAIIGTAVWNPSDTSGKVIFTKLVPAAPDGTSQKYAMDHYLQQHTDVDFLVQANLNSLCQGRAVATFIPLQQSAQYFDVKTALRYQSVEINPTSMNQQALRVKFRAPRGFLRRGEYFGYLVIRVYSPLTGVNPVPISMTVYQRLDAPSFQAPCLVNTGAVAQSAPPPETPAPTVPPDATPSVPTDQAPTAPPAQPAPAPGTKAPAKEKKPRDMAKAKNAYWMRRRKRMQKQKKAANNATQAKVEAGQAKVNEKKPDPKKKKNPRPKPVQNKSGRPTPPQKKKGKGKKNHRPQRKNRVGVKGKGAATKGVVPIVEKKVEEALKKAPVHLGLTKGFMRLLNKAAKNSMDKLAEKGVTEEKIKMALEVAGVLGMFDSPNDPLNPGKVLPAYPSLSNTAGETKAVYVGEVPGAYYHKARPMLDPIETDINYLLSSVFLIERTEWTTDDPKDDILFEADLNCLFGRSWQVMANNPGTVALSHFTYWKGDLVFRIRPVATSYHAGRLLASIGYAMNGQQLSANYNSVQSHVLDITEQQAHEIRVPFNAFTQWLEVPNLSQAMEGVYDPRFSMGTFQLRVLNPLSAATDTVSRAIILLIEVYIDDGHVAVIRPCPLVTVGNEQMYRLGTTLPSLPTAQSMPLSEPIEVGQGADDEEEDDPDVIYDPSGIAVGAHFEHEVTSMLEVVRRAWPIYVELSQDLNMRWFGKFRLALPSFVNMYAAVAGSIILRFYSNKLFYVAYWPKSRLSQNFSSTALNPPVNLAGGVVWQYNPTISPAYTLERLPASVTTTAFERAYPIASGEYYLEVSLPWASIDLFNDTNRQTGAPYRLDCPIYVFFRDNSDSSPALEAYMRAGDDFSLGIITPFTADSTLPGFEKQENLMASNYLGLTGDL